MLGSGLTTFTVGLVIGLAAGLYAGAKGAARNMLWRVRMHFYVQGMSHKGVDKRVSEVLRHPGLPSWASFSRIRDQRLREGLKP